MSTTGNLTTFASSPNVNVVKVNGDGTFIGMSWGGELQQYSATGQLIKSLATIPSDMKWENGFYGSATAVNVKGELFFSTAKSGSYGIAKYADGIVSNFVPVGAIDQVWGMVFMLNGDLALSVGNNGLYIKISPSGTVSTLAASHPSCSGYFSTFAQRYVDGKVGEVCLGRGQITADPSGAIYVADWISSTVRKIYNGRVDTVAGTPWLNLTTLGPGPGSIHDLRNIAFDSTSNSLVIQTGEAILRADLP